MEAGDFWHQEEGVDVRWDPRPRSCRGDGTPEGVGPLGGGNWWSRWVVTVGGHGG